MVVVVGLFSQQRILPPVGGHLLATVYVRATTTSRIRIIRKEKRRRKASEDDVIDAKSGLLFLFLYEMIDYETKLLWIKRRDAYRYVNSVCMGPVCVSLFFSRRRVRKKGQMSMILSPQANMQELPQHPARRRRRRRKRKKKEKKKESSTFASACWRYTETALSFPPRSLRPRT